MEKDAPNHDRRNSESSSCSQKSSEFYVGSHDQNLKHFQNIFGKESLDTAGKSNVRGRNRGRSNSVISTHGISASDVKIY